MAADFYQAIRPKRSWVQFRLRTFMLAIGVVALWLGWSVSSATRQRNAVKAIVDRGGVVRYDYQIDPRTLQFLPEAVSSQPRWIRWLLDDNYFHDVVSAGIDRVGTDDDLANFAKLPKLKIALICGGHVSDAGLAQLKNLKDLQELVLWGNPITGDGLRHLRELNHLKLLNLEQTQVTDDQLAGLKDLTGLESIHLSRNPQLTGSYLEYVADLPNLKSVDFPSGITDSSFAYLERAEAS